MAGAHGRAAAEGVIHLHDVDVLLKMAGCGLLDDLPELLGVEDSEIRVLSTAIHKIRNLGRQATYTEGVITSAVNFCASHGDLPEVGDEATYVRLLSFGKGMEEGEAILYTLAMEDSTSVIVSGDKVAMRLLGGLAGTDPLRAGLQGRFICFEELLLRYREMHGFERLRAGCCQGTMSDTVLRVVFGSGMGTTEEKAVEALHFHWQKLSREAGGLLVRRELPD